MVEAVTLKDMVAKVLVVTNSFGVAGKLKILQRSLVGAMDRQMIRPIIMLSLGGLM